MKLFRQSSCPTLWGIGLLALATVLVPTTAWAGNGWCPDRGAEGFQHTASMSLDSRWAVDTSRPCSSVDGPSVTYAVSVCPSVTGKSPPDDHFRAAETGGYEATQLLLQTLTYEKRDDESVSYGWAPVSAFDDAVGGRGQARIVRAEPTEHSSQRRAMCVEYTEGEQCEREPPRSVVVSFGSPAPVVETPPRFDIPWRPGDNEQMQPALVDLRVGPSEEHRRLPERPPPA